MFDKSYVYSQLIDMLKHEIIPDLKSSASKEQAIAMISVLKNLDANTVANQESYDSDSLLLINGLSRIASDIGKDANLTNTNLDSWAKQLPKQIGIIKATVKSPFDQWKELNQMACDLVELLYECENKDIQGYMDRARKLLREQLQSEVERVF